MGVSETSATSSNYAYDDQYASTNQSSPQDSSTTGNDSIPDSASTSDTTANGSTGTSPAAGDDQSSGDVGQTSSATNTQSPEDSSDTTASTNSTTSATSADSTSQPSGNSTAQTAAQPTTQDGNGDVSNSAGATAQQDAAPNAASPESSGTTAGATADGGAQGESGRGSSSSPASAHSQQAGSASTPRDTQGSKGAEGASVPATADAQPSASANTASNRDTGASAQAGPPLGTQGRNANASAQTAPTFGTHSNNTPDATRHSANASAQHSVAPKAAPQGAQQSTPENPAHQQSTGKTSQSPASPGTSQGNRSGDSAPVAGSPTGLPPNPTSSHAPANTQSKPNTPVLNGATQSELNGLLAKYDNEIDGRTQDSRNRANDAATADKIQQANDLDYTGYPQEVRAFAQRMSDSQAQLAALPPEMRDYYAGQLAALDSVYRNTTSSDERVALDQKTGEMEDDILAEYNHSINDPLDRTMAIFNHPVGAGYLDNQRQTQLRNLDTLRGSFLNAPDAAHREALFKQAVQLKTTLQRATANGADAYLKKDQTAWNDAFQYGDKLVSDAQNIQDPSKRYKSIGDGLFSFNTGMGEDDVADRRVLAFTQRMLDNPDLREKLDQWQVEAGQPLNADGASAALPYSEIVNNLPAAGPDYVRDLADQYTGVIKGQTDGERVAAFNQVKPYVQAAEGFARFTLGLTPLAPLSTLLDGSSTLSPSVRMGIDIGSAIAGGAIAPLFDGLSTGAKATSSFLQDLRAGADAADQLPQDIKLGMQNGELALIPEDEGSQAAMGTSKADTSPAHLLEPEQQAAAKEGEAAQTTYKPAEIGPSPDPLMQDARARIESNPMAVPSRYATQVDGNALKPDENAAGVLIDANKQQYIESGGQYFKVKYDSEKETWRVLHPDQPQNFSYGVRYDPQSGTWSNQGGGFGRGRAPLSRLVSLAKYAKSDPRIARMIESKVLKPQDPQTCFLDHGRVAQHAAGVPDGRLTPVSTGPLNANQLRTELEKGPLVLSARHIARPDSNYSGMHTVVLLKTVNEDGHDYVIGVDLDDTIGRNGQAQNLESGDFGGVKYDLDQLSKQATPYVDEDTGAQLEMYHRPQEKTGIWSWFS